MNNIWLLLLAFMVGAMFTLTDKPPVWALVLMLFLCVAAGFSDTKENLP